MHDSVGVVSSPQVVFAITHTTPGGLREIWQDVAQGLQRRGLRTGLVALYPQAGEGEGARHDGWQFIMARPLRQVLGGLSLLWATIGWLRRHRPEVVIAAMPLSNVLFALASTLARSNTRVILSHHTPSFTYQGALNRVDRWTGSLPCVVGVISVSDAVGASFDTWPAVYRAKRRTIHNSLSERIERMIDSTAPDDTRDHARNGRIVAVGRLSRQKNYPQLIRAMALLPQAHLDIIGAGEDEDELRDLIVALGLEQRVTLSGQMEREQTLRHAAQADVFVQVSLFEGHSLALIEAARLGLPLVVSQVDVQIEGVTGSGGELCGITVPLGDVPALADALRALLDQPETYRIWAERSARLGALRSSKVLIDHYAALLASHGVEVREPAAVSHIAATAASGEGETA